MSMHMSMVLPMRMSMQVYIMPIHILTLVCTRMQPCLHTLLHTCPLLHTCRHTHFYTHVVTHAYPHVYQYVYPCVYTHDYIQVSTTISTKMYPFTYDPPVSSHVRKDYGAKLGGQSITVSGPCACGLTLAMRPSVT